MNNYDVSIIFVNYKTKDLTINAINCVIEKTEGISYEIFVVDNASNDGSIEAIENQFPNINIIKSEINGGFGYANNLAIKQAKGKYILCLNTDTLLINNAIKIMFDFMEKTPNAMVCGGQLLNPDLSPQISHGEFKPTIYTYFVKFNLFNTLKNYIKAPKIKIPDGPQKTDSIVGADIFFRKIIFDEVGLFDENIFMYGEETELCYRITKAHKDIYILPDAKIIHLGGQSSNSEFIYKSKMWAEFYIIDKHKTIPIFLLKLLFLFKYGIIFLVTFNKKHLQRIIFASHYKSIKTK